MAYHIILIIVLLAAIFYGWQRGMARQLASLLGLAFGFVAARLFCVTAADMLDPMIPPADTFAPHPFGTPLREYTAYTIGAAVVFIIVYILFRILGGILTGVLRFIHTGAVNSILGAAFSFLKWVLLMSIAFNLWLVANPHCELMKYYRDGDGNIVELVMEAAPAMLGTPSPDELAHCQQMQEAQKMEVYD